MVKFKKYIGIATLVAIVAALGISSAAMAQSSTTPTPTAPTTQAAPDMQRGPGGPGLHSQVALDAAAKALGLTTDELSAQLWGGKTLADIATAQGVDIADVQAAVQAAELAQTKTAIADAVTAGTLTQAKADWLLEGLDKGYWGAGAEGGIGFGMGPGGFDMGPGGHGGRGGFGGPQGTAPNGNSTTPNSSTPSTGTTTPSGTAF